jgi:hypothetical protein
VVLLQLGFVLTSLSLTPAGNLSPIDESDPRIQSDVYGHLRQAHRWAKFGRWQQALAHADAILCLDDLGYTIEFEGFSSKDRARSERSLQEAIKLWEVSLEDQIKFRRSEDKPILTVHFQDAVISNGQHVGGHAKWLRTVEELPGREYRMNLNATIWIRTRQPNGKKMTFEQLRHVAAHELGHVLGLADSPCDTDIMGPLHLEVPVTKISDDERNSIRKVRDRALELRRASLISALMELEGYNLKSASR